MMLNKYVVIDLETTGNVPKKGDKIIQFAAVVIENGIIKEKYSSLVNPKKNIPAFIEELTGINNSMVKDAPILSEIAPKITELLEGAYFVAHNVLFDLSFLQEELLNAGFEGFFGPILDTVEMARILYPTADGYKLTDLADQENLVHDRPHQADSDALVTAELFLIFINKLSLLPLKTVQQLARLSGGLKSDLDQLLGDMIHERKNRWEILPESVEIFHNLALKRCGTEFPLFENHENPPYPGSPQEKTQIMQKAFSAFEVKMGQFEMMDHVYKAFNTNTHALIEAGTGVGKSLGYLLPSAFFTRQTGQAVVISTHTIQLQEQLLHKEIPLLNKILPFKIKAVLLKGRSHYVSLEKFSQTLKEENDNYDTNLTKMQILVWLTETETGDRDELNLSSGGLIYWNKIKGDQPAFLTGQEWLEKDFYLRAKEAAGNADLIITNHALLLSDLAYKASILPSFDYAVIDEGHHFEKAAGRFLGHTLDYLSVRLLLTQFGLYEQRQLFYKMERLFNAAVVEKGMHITTGKLNEMVSNLFYEMDEFFKITALAAKKNVTKRNENYNRIKTRLMSSDTGKEWLALANSGERLAFSLKDLINAINNRMEAVKKVKSSLNSEQLSFMEEVHSLTGELEELRSSMYELILKSTSMVKWVEVDLRSPQNTTAIYAQPASAANELRDRFFNMKKGVVVTSATLTVKQKFDYIVNELGLNKNNTAIVQIPSPFQYNQQVQLLIPDDLPDIKSVSTEDYVTSITEHIISIAEASRGRMLVLFTAQEMLKKTYELIKESGFLSEYAIIAQGITSGSRSRLTRNFKRYEKAILLGTSSFWEGIDIPGEDLSCLVIVRLPFSPPDDPLTEAKAELIKLSGGNPFSEYSLPEAILRFKQGFGRLIRTEQDRGVIVIFDKRITTANYGRDFLQSIPPIPIKTGNIDKLVERILSWL